MQKFLLDIKFIKEIKEEIFKKRDRGGNWKY